MTLESFSPRRKPDFQWSSASRLESPKLFILDLCWITCRKKVEQWTKKNDFEPVQKKGQKNVKQSGAGEPLKLMGPKVAVP